MQMLTNERAELKILHGGMADNSGGGIDDDDGGERKSRKILLHERFLKLGAPLTVVLVCFVQWVGYIYREKNSPHLRQLAIRY